MNGRENEDLDFSERELTEMNADVAGREADERPKRRSIVRVPSDEVPRPPPSASYPTEPSQPAFAPDPVDEIVEHAFSNGGRAEGVVEAVLALVAPSDLQPASDGESLDGEEALDGEQLDSEDALPVVDGDRESASPELVKDDETAPLPIAKTVVTPPPPAAQALAVAAASAPHRGVATHPALRAGAQAPPAIPPPPTASLLALARTVAGSAPAAASSSGDSGEMVLSSAPPPALDPARPVSVAREASGRATRPGDLPPALAALDPGILSSRFERAEDAPEELDDAALEEEADEVQAKPDGTARGRSLTPLPPRPPKAAVNGDGGTPPAGTPLPPVGAHVSAGAGGTAFPPAAGSAPAISTNGLSGSASPASMTTAPLGTPAPAVPAPGVPPADAASGGGAGASGSTGAPPLPPAASSGAASVPPVPGASSAPSATSAPPPQSGAAAPPLPTGAPPLPSGAPPLPASSSPVSLSGAPPFPSGSAPGAGAPAVPVFAGAASAVASGATAPAPPLGAESPLRGRKKRRTKQWFEEVFDDDYLRTLPYLTPRQTEREAQFILDALALPAGGSVLDLGCGYGRHAMELAAKGYKVTGLDLSLPLLIRAADAARRATLNINFIHGDMREMTQENEFDGAYCMFTTFGYFDDDTNRKVAANLQRSIRPGGRLLLELVNRDYLVRDLPTRVWWQGESCVVLEEVDFNYFSSRLQVQRSVIFEDGRQSEQEISIRAYSLHEIGKVLHHSGFRVTEVSGGLSLRGKFFGADSRLLLVLAEKK